MSTLVAGAFGLAIPLAVAAIYLSATGLWATLPVTAARLSAYANGSVFDAVSLVKLATVVALLGYPLIVVRFRSRRCIANRSTLVFAWAWLLIELAAVVAQRRMYAYHFLTVAPPAALLFGLLPQPSPARLVVALAPAAAISVACALHVYATPGAPRLPVAEYVSARTTPNDRVWSDDCPRLLLESDRRPGSRQALTFLFANDDATAGVDSAQIVADFAARRPAMVILPADLDRWLHRQITGIAELAANPSRAAAYVAGWRRIERYTLAHYRRETTIGDAAVYRRADDVRLDTDQRSTAYPPSLSAAPICGQKSLP